MSKRRKEYIGAQGEVSIFRLFDEPDLQDTVPGTLIISHSESGHHHALTGGTVMERTKDVPAGMKIFYAILENPERFEHQAPHAHECYNLTPGAYEFRLAREYDHFLNEARRVQD